MNLEKYKKAFWIAGNINNSDASLVEQSSETCLPELELSVSCEASNTLRVHFFYQLRAEYGIWNWTVLGEELNKRKKLKKTF